MENSAAKKLNGYLGYWLERCMEVERIVRERRATRIEIVAMKEQFRQTDFDQMFQLFDQEVRANIRTYKNIDYIDNYLEGSFPVIELLANMDDEFDHAIIKAGFEVSFFLQVFSTVKGYVEKLSNLYYAEDDRYRYSSQLKDIFCAVMQELQPSFTVDDIADEPEEEPEREDESKFDFLKFRQELDALPDDFARLSLIQSRLIDYEQFFIRHDRDFLRNRYGNSVFDQTVFYKLCRAEVKRYTLPALPEKEVQQEQASIYKWAASSTDLLEMLVALLEQNAIRRRDGKKVTRAEMIKFFQSLFDVDMKDPEGMLARATNRKQNLTPFIDSLKMAFERYAEEKDEKQAKRR